MAGRVEASIGIDNAPLRTGLEEARDLVHEFKSDFVAQFSESLALVGIEEAVRGTVEYGAKIQNLSERFAVGVVDLQQWGFAAKSTGLSLEDVARAFNRLEVARSKALQGNEVDIKAFQALGISMQDLREKSPADLMRQIGSSSMEAADMVAILGRNGLELAPMLRSVADGSQELGQAMNEGTISSLDQASQEIVKVENVFTVALGNIIAWGLTPLINTWKKFTFMVAYETRAAGDDVERFGNLVKNLNFLFAPGRQQFSESIKTAREQYKKDYDEFVKSLEAKEADSRKKGSPLDDEAGGSGGGNARESLAERLSKIDEDAARKRLTIEQQIAELKSEQDSAQQSLAATTNAEERKKLEDDIVHQEQEILRLKADGERQAAEAARKTAEERMRAEVEYQKMKEESLHRTAMLNAEEAKSPEEKRKILEAEAARLRAQMAEHQSDIDSGNDLVARGIMPQGSMDSVIEGGKKKLLDLRQQIDDINRQIAETQKKSEMHPRESFRSEPYDQLSSIGARLAGVRYGDSSSNTAKQSQQYIKESAYYLRLIYQKTASPTSNSATWEDGA